jgi:fructose-1-phosphate kinase PfkB-like protein
MDICFILKNKSRKTYNNVVCVKGSTCNEFEVDYYEKLKKIIRLQYHNEQNKVFL